MIKKDKKILISGGSGLVGMRLSELASAKGYQVCHLTRKAKADQPYSQYEWDIEQQHIDPEALKDCEALVHLAGAGIADERWTKDRKETILKSRTESTELLLHHLVKLKDKGPKTVLFASASGWYPQSEKPLGPFDEEAPPGEGFLAEVTEAWEAVQNKFKEELDVRAVQLRIGVVLSKDGGALPKMATPVKNYVGAALGTGQQQMPWIHLDDLAGMFLYALENPALKGVYNASADVATNEDFTKALAKTLGKPLLPAHVPGFVLKLALGEMANLVLQGTNMDNRKIKAAGYSFLYPELVSCLKDMYS